MFEENLIDSASLVGNLKKKNMFNSTDNYMIQCLTFDLIWTVKKKAQSTGNAWVPFYYFQITGLRLCQTGVLAQPGVTGE